jgi:hypothetical protein
MKFVLSAQDGTLPVADQTLEIIPSMPSASTIQVCECAELETSTSATPIACDECSTKSPRVKK